MRLRSRQCCDMVREGKEEEDEEEEGVFTRAWISNC